MTIPLAAIVTGMLATASLGAGIWLLLHLTALTAAFRGNADLVASPKPPQASRAMVYAMLAVFNLGWIGSIAVWSIAMDTAIA